MIPVHVKTDALVAQVSQRIEGQIGGVNLVVRYQIEDARIQAVPKCDHGKPLVSERQPGAS